MIRSRVVRHRHLASFLLPVAAALLILTGSAQAAVPWAGLAIVFKGSTVKAGKLPAFIALPNGETLNGIDLSFGFATLIYLDDDLLVYDAELDVYQVLPVHQASGLTLDGAATYDPDTGAVDFFSAGSLQETLTEPGAAVIYGIEITRPPTGGGGGGGSGGGGCTGTDTDGDGKPNVCDNCPTVANASQTDTNGNGVGDACDVVTSWVSPDAAPSTWTVSAIGENFAFSGPTTSQYSNDCEADKALGGTPYISISPDQFLVELKIAPPPPEVCTALYDPVAGILGLIGTLPDGAWTFKAGAPFGGAEVPFVVPEPSACLLGTVALASLALAVRLRRR